MVAASSIGCSLFLESGKPSSNNPFAALMGGGQMEKDEYGRPKAYRHYALGGVVTQVTEQVRAHFRRTKRCQSASCSMDALL